MANRALPALTPERRAMLERDLIAAAERERQAMLDKYVLTAAAIEAGMTTRDVAGVCGITSGTASRWRQMGELEKLHRTIPAPSDPGSST